MKNYNIEKEKKFWNSLAGRYDRFIKRIATKTYLSMFSNLKEDLTGAGHVLEIATGTGLIALEISHFVSQITAIDIAPEMIRVAKEKYAQHFPKNIDFVTGNALKPDFADKTFDAIIASNVMHLLPSPEVALLEMKRILKDDGKIILPTYLHGSGLKSHIISRLISLSGFKVRNRWALKTFRGFIAENGLTIVKEELIKDKIPLIYLVAKKA